MNSKTITIPFLIALSLLFIATQAIKLRASQQLHSKSTIDPLSEFDDEIVYIKSLKANYEGKYLSHTKRKGERRIKFMDEHEELVIGNQNMKWKIKYAQNSPGYFVIGNVGWFGRYIKSPAAKNACKIVESTYPEGYNEMLWKAEGSSMANFTLYNKRFEGFLHVQKDDDLEVTAHLDRQIYFKIYEPEISEFTDVVQIIDNPDDASYTYSVAITIGLSTTTTSSITITTEISAEVQKGMAKAAAKQSISTTWSVSQSYTVATTETHSVTVGKGRWEVRQLKANYGPLAVGSSSYGIYKVLDY